MGDAHVWVITAVIGLLGWAMKTMYFNHIRHWRAEIRDLKEQMSGLFGKLDGIQDARSDCRTEMFAILREHGEDLAAIKAVLKNRGGK